mgnify:CR=1 FL=1
MSDILDELFERMWESYMEQDKIFGASKSYDDDEDDEDDDDDDDDWEEDEWDDDEEDEDEEDNY